MVVETVEGCKAGRRVYDFEFYGLRTKKAFPCMIYMNGRRSTFFPALR